MSIMKTYEAPMLLSEAIRLGAMSTKPLKGDLVEKDGDTIHACALGAALFAVGKLFSSTTHLETLWPYLKVEVGPGETLMDRIVEHNDEMNWSRPLNANFVARWEKRHGILPKAPAPKRLATAERLRVKVTP